MRRSSPRCTADSSGCLKSLNHLFAGSDAAAQRLAMFYSFFGTCKVLGVNPYQWLKQVLEVMNETKLSELEELLPGRLVSEE